jgi:DNA polymerase lambda
LRGFDKPLYSADQLEGVPGIGEGIIKKVKELISEGTIKRFEFIDSDEKVKALDVLEGIWGLGPRGAEKLYAKGIKTVEDVRKNQHLLTDMQKIGLKYYEDFLKRIPRAEVE